MTDTIPDLAARLRADRKARGMGREKYGEMVGGLSHTKIKNLENGREPRDEELEMLAHLAFVQLDDEGDDAPSDAVRQRVLDRYAEIYDRLGGRPSAIAYPPVWGTPGQGSPQYWPLILEWCDKVDEWLDSLEQDASDGQSETAPSSVAEAPEADTVASEAATSEDVVSDGEGPGADIIAFPSSIDEAEDAEVGLATVTEEPEADDGVRRFSNGELRTFKRCRRKWWFTYYRKLGLPVRSVTGAGPLGTRVHRCLSVYYVPAGQTPGDPFAELERTVQEDLEIVGGDELKTADLMKDRDMAHAMLEGYFEWLEETAADQGIEVIAAETKVEVDPMLSDELGVPIRLLAKMDVRAKRTFGDDVANIFCDHKTVGDLTSPTKMLQFDEQMLHYHLCEYLDLLASGVPTEEAAAIRTDGALYNMLRKVKRTANAKPPFYARVEIRHNLDTLRSYWLRVKGEIRDILELTTQLDLGVDPRQVAYPNPTRDCSWDCDFYHVCTMADDGSRLEDALSSMFVEVNPLARYESTDIQ